MNQKMEKINEVLEKSRALQHVMTLLRWDLETEAPILATEKISKTLGYIVGENYSMIVNEDFKNLIYSINIEELGEIDKKVIKEIKTEIFEKLEKIPKEEYKNYSELKIISSKKWEEAKRNNDFEIFKNYLSEIIDLTKNV